MAPTLRAPQLPGRTQEGGRGELCVGGVSFSVEAAGEVPWQRGARLWKSLLSSRCRCQTDPSRSQPRSRVRPRGGPGAARVQGRAPDGRLRLCPLDGLRAVFEGPKRGIVEATYRGPYFFAGHPCILGFFCCRVFLARSLLPLWLIAVAGTRQALHA